jgi:ATP-dependent DNA helicase RecG
LEKLQLTEGRKLKRAAIVLFSKNPNQFYPNVLVKIGRFGKDSTDLKFHEVVEGNLIHMLNEVQAQLNHKFLSRPVDFVGMQRIEKDEYPVAALREMLLNALVHRTYMGAHVQLRVYDDKLSIWNEGGLPFGLTLEELKGEHNSRPRNPKIAEACFKAGYIDTWGRGTLKIINACKEAGLTEPMLEETNGGIAITLFKKADGKNSETIRKEFGNNSERIRKQFGKAIAHAFEVIAKHPDYSAEQIAAEISKTARTVEKYITKLKDAGILVRKGPKLGGYWEIIENE